MTNGPIEFLGEEFVDEKPHSEFGGGDGLIQGGDHEQTAGESHGIVVRAGRRVLSSREQWTGEADGEDGVVVDPLTGLEVKEENVVDGSTARLSDIFQAKLTDG